MSLSLMLYLVSGIFVLSIGIVLWKKGFWPGLVSACAIFLSGAFALRYDVQLGNILQPLKDFTIASFLLALVIGSALFSVLASQAPKIKYYFSKKGDKLINLAVVAAVLIVSFLLVVVVGKYKADALNNIQVTGTVTESQSTGLSAELGELNQKLGFVDGAGEIHGINHAAKRWFSIPLQIVLVLVFYLWAVTGAWAAEDSEKRKNISNPLVWKITFTLLFPIGLAAGLLIPVFVVDAVIPLLVFLVPALIYVKIRNADVPYEEMVLTKEHLSSVFSKMFAPKKKKKGGRKVVQMTIIDLSAYGKTFPKEVLKERTEKTRTLPGYGQFGTIVNNALLQRATKIEIDSSAEPTSLKYFIDGFWQPITALFRRPLSAQESQNLFTAMRVILGDNTPLQIAAQKNAKQETPEVRMPPKVAGQFFIEYDKRGGKKKKMLARLAVQNKGAGQAALIQFERIAVRFGSYEKMRVGQKRAEQMKQLLAQPSGIIVFSALPGQGLRTFTDVSFCETDRFTRDAATVEDVRHPYMPIENLPITTYDSSKGETPETVLGGVFFKEPKLLLIRDLVNKETLQHCCEETKNERMIVTTLRAKNSAQALMMLLRTGVDPKLLADSLTAIFTQKLIRTLCPECREEVPASEEMCRRLGIPPGKVKSFWRRRVHAEPEPGKRDEYVPCKNCMDLGYRGQAGLYDVIVINDEIRQIMTTKPSEEAIRRAAMKAGGGTFMADGVRMIVEGLTSVEELSRVLKEQ